jgi:hypothetical protein
MINEYVIKLIENLPDDIKNVKEPIKIDLVLDGGLFNGSYQVGALYFLKEMENRKYIKIERISGCSVGSIVGLYVIEGSGVVYTVGHAVVGAIVGFSSVGAATYGSLALLGAAIGAGIGAAIAGAAVYKGLKWLDNND